MKLVGYGETGSGKTEQIHNLIQAFGKENVAILSAEGGLDTIASSVTAEMVHVVNDLDGMRSGWAWLNANYNRPEAWCVVDGATRIMQYVSDAEFKGAFDMYKTYLGGTRPKDMVVANREYARFLTDGEKIDTRAIYVSIGLQTRLLIKKFLELKCNQYWNLLEQKTYLNQFEKGLPWKPDAPGAASDSIVEAFDWVFRFTRTDGGSCTAHTDSTSRLYRAKRRTDRRTGVEIPNEIADFNLAEFYRTVNAGVLVKA